MRKKSLDRQERIYSASCVAQSFVFKTLRFAAGGAYMPQFGMYAIKTNHSARIAKGAMYAPPTQPEKPPFLTSKCRYEPDRLHHLLYFVGNAPVRSGRSL